MGGRGELMKIHKIGAIYGGAFKCVSRLIGFLSPPEWRQSIFNASFVETIAMIA